MEYEPFIYCVDSPQPNISGDHPFLLVAGWIASTSGIISAPSLIDPFNQNHPINIIDRPDVITAYPDHNVLGFSQFLSYTQISSGEQWSLTFKLKNETFTIPINYKLDEEDIIKFRLKKQNKLDKINDSIACPICKNENLMRHEHEYICAQCGEKYSFNINRIDFLPEVLIAKGEIKPTNNVSANNYDKIALKWIEEFKNGIIH